MKHKTFALLITVLGLAACGGGGSDSPGEQRRPLFEYLLIDSDVEVAGDTFEVSFSASPIDPPTSSGTLSGGLIVQPDNGDPSVDYQVNGTFNGCAVSVRLSPIGQPVASPVSENYSGRFISADVLELIPATAGLPTLQLARVQPGSRDSGCR